ncbi:hypothetical protein MRX96_005461 [Rhipicephalus microplus]
MPRCYRKRGSSQQSAAQFPYLQECIVKGWRCWRVGDGGNRHRRKESEEAPKCRTALSPVVSAEAAVEMPSEPSSPAKDWYRSKAEKSAQEVLQLKKKVKTLQQSKRRLSKWCDASENLIKELKERKLLSEKGLEVFEATFSPEIQQLLVRAHGAIERRLEDLPHCEERASCPTGSM